jgi:predicted nucleotidyltransferase
MSVFTAAQLADLRDLKSVCDQWAAEAVIIGATAFRIFINPVRPTYDIDLAIAVELQALADLERSLIAAGWHRERQEHRWRAPRGTLMDLLPAGHSLRASKRLVWPESGLAMSLAGFDHVFEDAVPRELAAGLIFKVIPPPVLALLKMVSYSDDPHRRAKDLTDLGDLFRSYEQDSERLFSDKVFEAQLADIEFAGAFLLGTDLRAIATMDDLQIVQKFIQRVHPQLDEPIRSLTADDDLRTRETARFQQQIEAFTKGLGLG